ncbi:ribosome recycling factor [Patescibacteria group bacterium]|nr:ribosome recycling factor [Patescibacteria group bacterium]
MNSHELKTKLDKSLEFLKTELSHISTGRASPALINDISVVAYETPMTIKEVASITMQDAQNLVIVLWDKSLLKAVVKAIRESELSLNPIEDTDKIRIQIPALTEERRKEFAKQVSIKVEECKIALRNIRQETMKEIDKDFNDKSISEDDRFYFREEVEETVRDYIDKVEDIGSSKKEEILSI